MVNREAFQTDCASACHHHYWFCVCEKEVWWAGVTLCGHPCVCHSPRGWCCVDEHGQSSSSGNR